MRIKKNKTDWDILPKKKKERRFIIIAEVPKPKVPDKFCFKFSIYLFLMGIGFLTMGKPPRANLMAQGKVLKLHSKFFSLVCLLLEKA